MSEPESIVGMCYHCGNRVPLQHVATHVGQQLYEHLEGRRHEEQFTYVVRQCPTCGGMSIFGDFTEYPAEGDKGLRPLYPAGVQLLPETHKLAPADCVPQTILDLYCEVWPLRQISPSAFAGQIRALLEYICDDQGATGANLYQKLKDLVARGTFPGYFAEITDLMRKLGNLGVHAGGVRVDYWDAELLDDFFRSVVEYVYIAPSRIARMRQRIDP